jgi:RNA polymerase sigma-70 factor, ECF subfamily
MNVATYMLRNRTDAEDEVQRAFSKTFEHLDQYLGEAEFFRWLLRIVINECLQFMRAKKRARFFYLDARHNAFEDKRPELLSHSADPEDQLVSHEIIEVLRTEMRRIPLFFRAVILLRDVEGRPMSEVADRLGITVSAAKSRLRRARRELRDRVTRRCGGARHIIPLSPR